MNFDARQSKIDFCPVWRSIIAKHISVKEGSILIICIHTYVSFANCIYHI